MKSTKSRPQTDLSELVPGININEDIPDLLYNAESMYALIGCLYYGKSVRKMGQAETNLHQIWPCLDMQQPYLHGQ